MSVAVPLPVSEVRTLKDRELPRAGGVTLSCTRFASGPFAVPLARAAETIERSRRRSTPSNWRCICPRSPVARHVDGNMRFDAATMFAVAVAAVPACSVKDTGVVGAVAVTNCGTTT